MENNFKIIQPKRYWITAQPWPLNPSAVLAANDVVHVPKTQIKQKNS